MKNWKLLILRDGWFPSAKTAPQVDDDQIYGPRLLEKLLTATGPLPGRAIGAATQHAYHYLQGAVLEGVHGVLFQRKFFDHWASKYEGCWASSTFPTYSSFNDPQMDPQDE